MKDLVEPPGASSPESSPSLETVVSGRLPDVLLQAGPSLLLHLATVAHVTCACAMVIGQNLLNYASIMLDALKDLLCLKLCRHKIGTPTMVTDRVNRDQNVPGKVVQCWESEEVAGGSDFRPVTAPER